MSDETTVRGLKEKVDRLEVEQERLKEEQKQSGDSGADGSEKKSDQEGSPSQIAQEPPAKPKKPFAQRARRYVKRNPARVLVGAIALVLLIVGSALLYAYLSSYESTDDAQVDGHLNMISSRIRGTVVGVYVENNQYVKAGQVIVDLDPRDSKVALQQANAAYAEAVAQLHAESPNVPIIVTTNQTTIAEGQADICLLYTS